jgi:magnesium-transporting ATPase (P-type)
MTPGIPGIAALISVFGYLVIGMFGSDIFRAVAGPSVAAIPERLQAMLKGTPAIRFQGMAARRDIMRRLPAIEALGSVSVTCSGKMGTLTRNEMTVVSVATARRLFAVTGPDDAPHGATTPDGREADVAVYPRLGDLARGAILCNDADLRQAEGRC